MERSLVLAMALLVSNSEAANSPSEPDLRSDRWLCGFVSEWKTVMARDYPASDRSTPPAERYCHLPRD